MNRINWNDVSVWYEHEVGPWDKVQEVRVHPKTYMELVYLPPTGDPIEQEEVDVTQTITIQRDRKVPEHTLSFVSRVDVLIPQKYFIEEADGE